MPNLLSEDELAKLQSALTPAKFVDGILIAGWYTKPIENTRQNPAKRELLFS